MFSRIVGEGTEDVEESLQLGRVEDSPAEQPRAGDVCDGGIQVQHRPCMCLWCLRVHHRQSKATTVGGEPGGGRVVHAVVVEKVEERDERQKKQTSASPSQHQSSDFLYEEKAPHSPAATKRRHLATPIRSNSDTTTH
eukprot:GHVL01037718.1.p2 GENE.GHVL01037718.1~~GHVL01037718.1.p2  ORF type:complete len:138 (-),score=17.24 GHVL01037718.1:9-422(-)